MPPKKSDIITGDEVTFNTDPKDQVMHIPQGWTYSYAFEVLQRLQEQMETPTRFSRQFNYRYEDMAIAAAKVLKETFGIAVGVPTFFSPPDTLDVKVDVDKTVTVPWGVMELPGKPGLKLSLGTNNQVTGSIVAMAPYKYKAELNALFDGIEAELKANSIYRGKALSGASHPEFLDLDRFDESEIVFAEGVEDYLRNALWGPITYRDETLREGLKWSRNVLLYGPYGTGKTSAGMITAKHAVAHGVTYVSAKPGDNLTAALQLARLYSPAVLMVEDVDTADENSPRSVRRLLDAIDGTESKQAGDLIVLFTSNHQDKIHKGMLRPGRIDYAVEVGALDKPSVQRLAEVLIQNLEPDIDWDEVFGQMDGFEPAFVRATFDRAKAWGLYSGFGAPGYTIGTSELARAASSLHSQLDLLNAASEADIVPALDLAFMSRIREAVGDMRVVDGDGDEQYAPNRLAELDENGDPIQKAA